MLMCITMCITSYPSLSMCYCVHMPRIGTQDPQVRFWKKVHRVDDGCWLWTAGTYQGYGRFRHEGVNWLAHRLAWTWEHGEVPEGLTLDHTCRVRNCVRPSHLEVMTPAENCAGASRFRSPPWYVRLESGRLNP